MSHRFIQISSEISGQFLHGSFVYMRLFRIGIRILHDQFAPSTVWSNEDLRLVRKTLSGILSVQRGSKQRCLKTAVKNSGDSKQRRIETAVIKRAVTQCSGDSKRRA